MASCEELLSMMFRPPIDRTMRVLDRSFFKKKVVLSAAVVLENSDIHRLRKTLASDILQRDKIHSVRPSPAEFDGPSNRKAILLRPAIQHDVPETWPSTLRELSKERKISIVPLELDLDYNIWDYGEIMNAILPQDDQDEIPSGFAVVGHIAHLNLRKQYLPYKYLIADVLLDKNPAIKTVINKVDDVGAENEFRTFKFELLKGDPNMQVELREQDCVFRFDYSKVYWNTRLGTEHERLVNKFTPGEAVCDVMAGVGPFAVPAAKRKVFVWANDLNPDSHKGLLESSSKNKVDGFLKPYNLDGRQFIRESAEQLLQDNNVVIIRAKTSRSKSKTGPNPKPVHPEQYHQPKTFQHYVMNLPATATEFLDAFVGLYEGKEKLFASDIGRKLPLIHVYCFSTKSEDNRAEGVKISEELSTRLKHKMEVGKNELEIYDVRDVAPNKRMFCASFRLPEEVAFAVK